METEEENLCPARPSTPSPEEENFCPAQPSTPSPEEDSSSEEDERRKALRSLKRSRELKNARTRKRIRKLDSSSEEDADPTEDPADFFKNKEKSAVRRILSSDEDLSSNDDDTDGDSFIDDDDDNDGQEVEETEEDEWSEMLERLRRSDSKYRGLTSQYEDSILESRGSGAAGQSDLSDDEQEMINKYPQKLLLSLREAVVEAHRDSETAPPEDVEQNDQLIQMWEMYDYREDKEKDGECVCGQTGLRHLFFMRIKENESWAWHTRIVGSECIKWFIRANFQPNLGVIFKLLIDGVVATFTNRQGPDRKCLEFSLGGRGSLPPVLLQHKNDHALDYKLPIRISESDLITMVVTAVSAKTRDQEGKVLKKGEKYRVFTKPSFRPSKDRSKIPIVDFILIKVVNLRAVKSDAASTSSNQYKPESFIKN